MSIIQSRRHFLTSASLAAAAGVLGPRASRADEGPPETTTIRLQQTTTICFAPLYVLEAFLRAEGFTDLRYVSAAGGYNVAEMVARGEIDVGTSFAGTVVYHLDSGWPITAIGGMHVGCYELFAREPIRNVSDLKGRRVGIQTLASSAHLYLTIMATHIGLDAQADIEWVTSEGGSALEGFVGGETDVFLGFPPEPQELRRRGVDRVILNTILDRPWSLYFCCMMYGNADWVRDHPVATKRFLRAIYKAADFCTAEPASASRQLVDGGFAEIYDDALQTIEDITYDRWHEFDSEDTLRFYGLRLHEAGMLNHSPNALIADGTDWRFVNELKHELRA
jgi:NitT/TauT family transport system substrate-binding protein